MKKFLIIITMSVGVLLFTIGIIYLVEPAKSLPSFFPGHASLMTKHYKHGIGAILLSLGCFAFTWFQSGKKLSEEKE